MVDTSFVHSFAHPLCTIADTGWWNLVKITGYRTKKVNEMINKCNNWKMLFNACNSGGPTKRVAFSLHIIRMCSFPYMWRAEIRYYFSRKMCNEIENLHPYTPVKHTHTLLWLRVKNISDESKWIWLLLYTQQFSEIGWWVYVAENFDLLPLD